MPTTFVADEDSVHSIEVSVRTLLTTSQYWWEPAIHEIKKHAFQFECTAISEGKVLLMQSNNHILPPKAWAFL